MPLAQSPLREDELVTAHQAQGFVQRGTRARRKNYVGERAPGGNRLDRPASAESTGEKVLKWSRHQRGPLPWRMELISLLHGTLQTPKRYFKLNLLCLCLLCAW